MINDNIQSFELNQLLALPIKKVLTYPERRTVSHFPTFLFITSESRFNCSYLRIEALSVRAMSKEQSIVALTYGDDFIFKNELIQ